MKEVNQLIDLATQMGLIEGLFEETVQNRTKCRTWSDIYESHMEKREDVAIGFDAIKGLMILLSIGLTMALVVFVGEHIAYRRVQRQMRRDPM